MNLSDGVLTWDEGTEEGRHVFALVARAEKAEAEVARLRACLQRVADCSQDPISKADAFTELLVLKMCPRPQPGKATP